MAADKKSSWMLADDTINLRDSVELYEREASEVLRSSSLDR